MCLCNLPAKYQSDPRAAAFRGEERHEKIRRVRKARAFIAHNNHDCVRRAFVPDEHAASSFGRGIDGVADQVDESLLQLVRIALNGQLRSLFIEQMHALFEQNDTMKQRIYL